MTHLTEVLACLFQKSIACHAAQSGFALLHLQQLRHSVHIFATCITDSDAFRVALYGPGWFTGAHSARNCLCGPVKSEAFGRKDFAADVEGKQPARAQQASEGTLLPELSKLVVRHAADLLD